MNFIRTDVEGVWILEPRVFQDERGYFYESYNKATFDATIGKVDFIQDNQSHSTRGVLRGMHYQQGEASQAKLVRVLHGAVLDVAVDLRKHSPTFGQYVAVELTAENHRQLFIPRGFAHGFLVLSDTATFAYKVDNIYCKTAEVTLAYDDPTVNIAWPTLPEGLLLSEKDRSGLTLDKAPLF